ncbi:hypothetical protein AB0D08_35615 [Kitasatospora sp. NPDC048540]|uniref:LppU/SCO3897 family protein n=1 Tax=unclassified Kitasatospora TaxID=2633591 RepID=UPI00068BB15E|nr:hypothetical protein [Kitasatospora sp. MBT63]
MTTPPTPPAADTPADTDQPKPEGRPAPQDGVQADGQPTAAQPEPQPYAAYPPLGHHQPEVPKKKGLKSALIGVVAVVVAAGLALFAAAYFMKDQPASAKAGDCVHNSGSDTKPDVKVVDCKSANADLKVLKVVHSSNEQECDTEDGVEFTYTEERRSSIFILCLGKNG